MGAIGLNPIRLDRIGLDPIRINAIKLGVPGASSGSDRPYIDPEVLASLKAVCICYGKSNDDPDRAVVKNLVDPDNPFVISNAAYEGMSGYNGYPVVFGANKTWRNKALEGINGYIYTIDANKYNIRQILANNAWAYSYIKQDGKLTDYNKDIKPFKIKVTGLQYDKFVIKYSYINSVDATDRTIISITSDGIYELPKSFASDGSLTDNSVWIGFNFTRQRPDIPDVIKDVNVTIEILPSFEGAFVTDGVNDLITSTKPVQEMLGGSNEITVVSMIHQVKDSANNVSFTNYIRGSANGYFRNIVNNYDKTGIYGYTSSDLMGLSVVNNILGDKNDYTANGDNGDSIINGNFSVQGYSYNDGNNTGDFSSVAWYWTIIANKVLTTDQINQVIAYFNLDRTLNPDILCNTIKQGITNENHAEFGDKLIDFSGNGRDIQLNNIAWKGDSGIGKYEVDFSTWSNKPTETFHSKSILEAGNVLRTKSAASSMKVKVQFDKEAIGLSFRYFEGGVSKFIYINSNGEYSLPPLEEVGVNEWEGFSNNSSSNVTITQIPSHAGALCLDGVNDFGKVTGMPVYKDYTFIIDREIISIGDTAGVVASKSEDSADATKHGAFIFEYLGAPDKISTWSFYKDNGQVANTDFTRGISYQSKYSYNGKDLTVGTSKDSDKLWLGTIRDNDFRSFNGAIYSLMSFPYSMSEFLIERQLKKHKLGTLYPDMVELRPIIKANAEHGRISYYNASWNPINVGDYLEVGARVNIVIDRLNIEKITEIKVSNAEYVGYNFDEELNHWNVLINLTSKSPQKINITIDEYIRFEDIVQPYPLFFEFTDENGNLISWGGKAKVGSTITRTKGVNYANLLEGLFTITNPRLNGVPLSSSQHVVEKSMVFTCTATWAFDNNEPKCILSPRLLSIPNSSYKILGYIPDISGHGNNGKINNSAYAGASGANGYLQNFSEWTKASGVSSTDSVISSSNNLVAANAWIAYVTSGTVIPTFKVEISGIPVNGNLRFEGSDQTLVNGVNTIQGITTTKVTGFYISSGYDNDWSNLKIEQIGEYEGAYCFDGVDDFVTIPTTVGGKQVLMKVNWDSPNASILYDQRGYNNEFAIYNGTNDSDGNPIPAYQGRNNGQTYIDGILNNNINASELQNITHNITITNELSAGVNTSSPVIGSNRVHDNFFTNMALYDFMLFDNISTDDKIKELNKYVGIEGNVWGILTQLSNSTLISNETLIKNK